MDADLDRSLAWESFGKCPYCFAKPGRPCMTRTTAKYIRDPHPGRPERAAAIAAVLGEPS